MDLDSFRIQELLETDQPRERLLTLGAQNLSNTELVSLLLEAGTEAGQPEEAAELTRRVLAQVRSLRTLARCDLRELAAVPGMTLEKAALLVVSFELGRRVARETIARLKVDSPEVVCQLMAHDYRGLTRESLRVLLLDTKYQLLRIEEISLGSLNESIAHPREIFRAAIVHSAYAIILTHNHPSGDPAPSRADHQLTRRVAEVGQTLGIEVADHIIIGGVHADSPSYYSFKEEGKI